MRLVFAGTPEVAVPALDALLASRHEVVAVAHPARRAAPAAAGSEAASPVGQRAAERRRRGAASRPRPRDPEFLDRLRRARARLLPGRRLRRAGAAAALLDIPRARLGQPALLAAARLARRGAGAARDPARRRGDRRHDVPPRGGAGHRAGASACSPSRSGPRDTSGDLLDRLADRRRRAAGRHPGRASSAATLVARAAARRGRVARARSSPSRTPGSTGRRRRSRVDRLVRACTPAPGAWTTCGGERLKLGPVAPTGRRPDARRRASSRSAGATVLRRHRRRSAVRARRGPARRASGRWPAADWARGARGLDRRDAVRR